MRPINQSQIQNEVTFLAKKFYDNILKSQLNTENDSSDKIVTPILIVNNYQSELLTETQKQLIKPTEVQKKYLQIKKYRVYTVDEKKMIIDEVKKQFSQSSASLTSIIAAKSLKYKIHKKNISRWFKLEEIKEREGGRKAAYPQIQQKLIQFIAQNPKSKRKSIVDQAKKLYDEIADENKKQFNFSKGWYQRFKVRNRKKLKIDETNSETIQEKQEVKIQQVQEGESEIYVKIQQGIQ